MDIDHEVILFKRICVRVLRFDVNTLKDINIFYKLL